MMIFLFPVFVAASLVAVIADAVKARSIWGVRRGLALVLAALFVSYAVAFGLICLDPTFDDNGAPEVIAMCFRWIWALEIGGWLAVLIVPVTLGARSIYRAWRSRSA